ncbi:hypothetical protein [Caldimonas sp. KR1-144]|uniref:hypothetical protein n=1 Tax=Caldimonas sp. KR1-144 TaxID=3400911 RepID=UPI003C0D8B08
MDWFARFTRSVAKHRFRLLGLATINDIPSDSFESMLRQLVATGWKPGSRYRGIDAGIDYSRSVLAAGALAHPA